MNRCPNCFGKVSPGTACSRCGEQIPRSRHRPTPRAYRKLDSKNWVVGVSAGGILLASLALALGRTSGRLADQYADRVDREEAIDRSHLRVGAGEMKIEEFEIRETESYVLVVKPQEAACRAAFSRVGELGGPPPDRALVMQQLRKEGVEVDRLRPRTLEGRVERGRWAWAVWHDHPKPVRIYVDYRDTRR